MAKLDSNQSDFVIVEMIPANGVFPRVPLGRPLIGNTINKRVIIYGDNMKAVSPINGRLYIRLDDDERAPYESGRSVRESYDESLLKETLQEFMLPGENLLDAVQRLREELYRLRKSCQ